MSVCSDYEGNVSAVEVISNFKDFASLSVDDINWEFDQTLVHAEEQGERGREGEEEGEREGEREEGEGVRRERLEIEEDDVTTSSHSLSVSQSHGKYGFNTQFANAFSGLLVLSLSLSLSFSFFLL